MDQRGAQALLCAWFVVLSLMGAPAAESVAWSVRLTPDATPLPKAGVPFLHETVEEAIADSDGLSLEPETAHDWWKAEAAEEPFRLKLQVDSNSFTHGVLTVWNWHNRAVAQWKVASGVETWAELHITGKGVYQLTLDGYADDVCQKRLVRSIAVTEDLNAARETWKREEFFLGVCAFPGRYHWSFRGEPTLPKTLTETAARELEANALARLGFQVVRPDESMEMGQSTTGYQYQFDRMDAAVTAYTSRGFELALQLMHAPDWAIAKGYQDVKEHIWRYPRAEDPQRAYVKALLDRYGRHARFVQIFNEPDQVQFWSGTPEEFVAQLRYTREEIRKFDSQLPILQGGYSLVEPSKTRYYLQQLDGLIDYAAYHSHGSLRDLMEDHATLQQMKAEVGAAPRRWINTEMGYDGWRLDQERRKGQIVPQKTLYCWASDHAGVLLFGGRMTLAPKRTNQDFGFLDHQFCPRFVVGSLSAMVSTLDGASFHSIALQTDEIFVYQFQRGENRMLAAFTLGDSAEIEIQSNANAAIQTDEMGNRHPLDEATTIRMTLDGYPRYLTLVGVNTINVTTAD